VEGNHAFLKKEKTMANMQYSYLPELGNLTGIQQRELGQQYRGQRSKLSRAFAKQPMQGSGAYMSALSRLGAAEAEGMGDIEAENIYKNAMLGREERLTKEGRDWQDLMADKQFKNQMKMMQTQRDWQNQDALMGGLGSLVGMGASFGLGQWGQSLSPITQRMNKFASQGSDEDFFKLFGIGG
jgi:hypothetical protein